MDISTHNDVAQQSHVADVSESGVDSHQFTPRIVVEKPAQGGSYFAQWFKVVDPNDVITEDKYFWPSGSPLEPDNFEGGDDQLDAYLTVDHNLEESSVDSFSLSLPVDFGENAPQEVVDWDNDDERVVAQVEEDLGSDLDPLPLKPAMSDWTQMPEILPPFEKDTTDSAVELTSNLSDWDDLPQDLSQPTFGLSAPQMTPKTSDYLYLVPQVVSETQASLWDDSGVEQLPNFVVPYVASIAPTTFPVVQASGYNQNGHMMPLYQTTVYHWPYFALGISLL